MLPNLEQISTHLNRAYRHLAVKTLTTTLSLKMLAITITCYTRKELDCIIK